MAFELYKGALFSSNTPSLLMDTILDCIERKVLVHILTGDPITGLVSPSLESVGYFYISTAEKDTRPMVMFKSRRLYASSENTEEEQFEKTSWIRTDKILKINEVDSCKLLYQSYECHSAPLSVETCVTVSPYGDVTQETMVVCKNPEVRISVPSNINPVLMARFLFGQIHFLPDCLEKFNP